MTQSQNTTEDFDFANRKVVAENAMPDDIKQLAESVLKKLKTISIPTVKKRGSFGRTLTVVNNSDSQKNIEDQIKKITSLKLLQIPAGNNELKNYYILDDNAGGVTEKTCLIDEATLKATLTKLNENIHDNRATTKIRMNAILKHPKAGVDTEVQREAIGLEIARILGFKSVTDSTMVSYNIKGVDRPCLFVPFGNMTLLTESIDSPQTYEGRIQASQQKNIEDFGKYSAYFMLCSDTDFIGKNGQNKGLTNMGDPKSLYIFDQVFMADNNFSFDDSLNLTPSTYFSQAPSKVARHFMGRNKSVINDSSYEEKISGVMHLIKNEENISSMLQGIANKETQNSTLIRTLCNDARKCLTSFLSRMNIIKSIIPPVQVDSDNKSINEINDSQQEIIKKSMLLNRLLNKPILFDQKGQPYRAPYVQTTHTKVSNIAINSAENSVTISLRRGSGQPLSDKKRQTLQKFGFEVTSDGNSAKINIDQLKNLNENNFFIIQENIKADTNYLDLTNLSSLAQAYGARASTSAAVLNIASAENFQFNTAIDALNQIKNGKQDLGFIQHVQEHFMRKQMQTILHDNHWNATQIEENFNSSDNKINFIQQMISEQEKRLKESITFSIREKSRLEQQIPLEELPNTTSKPQNTNEEDDEHTRLGEE